MSITLPDELLELFASVLLNNGIGPKLNFHAIVVKNKKKRKMKEKERTKNQILKDEARMTKYGWM